VATKRPSSRPSRSATYTTKLGLEVDTATSERLGRIRQHGTAAELTVRRIAHRLGLRFRVQNRDLAGSPDLANRRRHWAVFVHGCYWHRHSGCYRTTTPKRNSAFWNDKFATNVARDARVQRQLEDQGYAVVVIWECASAEQMEEKLRALLTRQEQPAGR